MIVTHTGVHSIKDNEAMPHELALPRARSETIYCWVLTFIVMFFVLLSVADIVLGFMVVLPGIWLIYVTFVVWSGAHEAHGLRNYLINQLGDLAGRRFVDSAPEAGSMKAVRFGFQLCGHRFIQETVALDRIESVEWDTGQATSLAGHDMNDWHICLWFDLDEALIAQRPPTRWKSQGVVVVGPSKRKQDAEALGLSFVDFLRRAGVTLIQSEKETRFVRG